MKVIEKIMAKDSRGSLRKCIAEIEEENSHLKASTVESAETIDTLQHSMNSKIEDYNLLQEGNKNLLAKCDELRYHSKDMDSELARVRSSVAEDIAALESRIRFAEAHSVEVAAVGEKCLSNFDGELIEDLAGMRALYECNIQSMGGLCLPMPKSEPSAVDYICWLSAEVTGLPKVFDGVNESFISVAIEGTLVMAGDSIDLAALQTVAVDRGVDILPEEQDVRRAARVILRKWWRSFGYNYVLATI
jgi:hypothetical protein